MYKTVIVKYSPKAKELAVRIEETANKMEQEGFELVSCSIMPSAKGILVFKKTDSKTERPEGVEIVAKQK